MTISVLRALGVGILALGATVAPAQQIVTAVESEHLQTAAKDKQVSSVAGQALSTNYGGANVRALTDYGVNKISARGNATHETYATSAWLDTYTVSGAAGTNVSVAFKFAIDGSASFGADDEAEFNFGVVALRGENWKLSPISFGPSLNGAAGAGEDFDTLMLSQTTAGRVTQLDTRNYDGVFNFANAGGEAGAFQSRVTFVTANTGFGSYFSVTDRVNAMAPLIETRLYAAGFQQFNLNGTPAGGFLPYQASPSRAQQRANLVNNFAVMGSAKLCSSDCAAGVYPGSELTLNLTVAAGSKFTLAALLSADDVFGNARVDFYNTAKVSQVTVSPGATLTSLSGALQHQPGGDYGYPAALAPGVPEPASWAMLISGFGLLGASARRRRPLTA